jgi:hypothetical protein
MNKWAIFEVRRAIWSGALVAAALILGGSIVALGQNAAPSAGQDQKATDQKGTDQKATEEKATAAPSPASIEKGKSILQAAAKAAGGDALKAVHNVQVETSGQAFAQGTTFDIQLLLTIDYPNKLHTQATLPQGEIQQTFDGTNGWIVTQDQGVIDLPAEYIPEFKRGIALAGAWGLYRDVLDGKVDGHFVDEEEVDGHKVEIVEWTSDSGPVKLYFDAATHFLTGAHFEAVTPQGSVQADQRWSDFKTVSGCQYPYHSVVFHNGQKFTETEVKSIKTNVSIDPTSFKKPPTPPAQ